MFLKKVKVMKGYKIRLISLGYIDLSLVAFIFQ